MLEGGFGSAVLEYAAAHDGCLRVSTMGVEGRFLPQGDHANLLRETGLDEETLYLRILNLLGGEEPPHA